MKRIAYKEKGRSKAFALHNQLRVGIIVNDGYAYNCRIKPKPCLIKKNLAASRYEFNTPLAPR